MYIGELCEEMASLKDTFKVYTFRPSLFERLRYSALSWTPTFNRGYDVERELVRSFSRGPFTTRDPNQATAFFVPVMPYLDRVSGFPSNGRANMRARFNAFVESRKKTRLWRGTDCKRFAATVHDYGTNFALDQPHALKTTTFVSSNAEWIARDGVTGQVSGEPYSVEKDVASVCSSSYYLPAKAVEYRVFGPNPRFRRRTLVSFKGGMSSTVRRRVAALVATEDDPRIDISFSGHVSSSAYMEELASSKFCLHMKGSRVVSPRLIESVWFGCVPVILADHYDLPLSHLVDWNTFAVIIPEADADELFSRIRTANWRALRENLQRVAPMFLYHRRPIFGDAFYSTALAVRDRIAERSQDCARDVFEGFEADIPWRSKPV